MACSSALQQLPTRRFFAPPKLNGQREVEVYRIRVDEGDVLSRKLLGSLAEVEGRALQEKVQTVTIPRKPDVTITMLRLRTPS